MIERGHREAFKIVTDLANKAMEQGNIQEVALRTNQMNAIAKLEQARREIFSDVPDLETESSPLQRTQASEDLRKLLEGLPQRVTTVVFRYGISSIEQLRETPDEKMLRWRNFGEKSLAALRTALANYQPKSD